MTDFDDSFGNPFGDQDGELDDAARSVSELIDDINVVLVREFRDVWVYGEVTKVSNPSSGHCYFDLVEDVDGEKKMIAVKLFRGVRQRLVPKMKQHELDIVSGIKVRIRGTPDVYAASGSFGFKMSDIDPRFTLGDLAAKRDEIVDRLKKEGLYDRNRRATLPLVPLSIGLVASKGSAAHADFMKTLEQSNIGFTVSLCDVRVQGDGAASGVAGAIALFSELPGIDLVAVIRGGGSRVDLATFDDESIARAIAACQKPVFTGIGHEVDTSIADEVAYSWNKTPTACAVSIIDKVVEFVRQVDESAQRIATVVLAALANSERRIANAAGRLRTLRTTGLDSAKSRINELAAQIAGFDPVILMRRGWSITYDADGAVLRSVSKVNKKAEITTRLADGTLVSTVTLAADSAESSSKK
ncbi:MAG: exodeoxyribonuclease VII large subunit [Ilumatobacteraceae bacterium]|nr:exodeoxyribonuclease VII large subunit [Ilumatobacteraceae bacterium]